MTPEEAGAEEAAGGHGSHANDESELTLIADFPPDRARALLFARTPDAYPAPDLLDEDARDHAPVVVLGPSRAVRYAVDLRHAVHRVTAPAPNAGEVAFVGGPEDGFAVFDAAHRLRREA